MKIKEMGGRERRRKIAVEASILLTLDVWFDSLSRLIPHATMGTKGADPYDRVSVNTIQKLQKGKIR